MPQAPSSKGRAFFEQRRGSTVLENYDYKVVRTGRACGILLHITSLPSPYGIGTLGRAAYQFVDFLARAKEKYWQVLPLGPTGYGNSPYQSSSSYAGNPYLIDLDLLVEDGLLVREEIAAAMGDEPVDPAVVDYDRIRASRDALFQKAYARFLDAGRKDELVAYEEKTAWLGDDALFAALQKHFDGEAWSEWPEAYRDRDEKALRKFRKKYEDEVLYEVFLQFLFERQWHDLKRYANERGVKIIGDIPIYVAADSVDVWKDRELFLMDGVHPRFVGGCPPDDFSSDGQLWGNPVYDWDVHEETGYAWWIARIARNFELYDTLRIDHFRGFESFWAVPAGDETAAGGSWLAGPAMKLFDAVKDALGELDIIAEDLGYMTEEVYRFREKTGFPGMKILQFAWNPDATSDYLIHNLTENSVVYLGTHDNSTLEGWKLTAPLEELRFAEHYLGTDLEHLRPAMIRAMLMSVSRTVILQMQDVLGLDDTARMNLPGTVGAHNWSWRMTEPADAKTADDLAEAVKIYGRG